MICQAPLLDGQPCGGNPEWCQHQQPEDCGWCDGTGILRFCPSTPDKCPGCEEMPCECRAVRK